MINVPPGFAYAVIPLHQSTEVAFARDVGSVIRCMPLVGGALNVQVIRVSDDELVWPIHSKGGTA